MSYLELIAKALHGRSVNRAAKELGIHQRNLDRYSKAERLPDYDDALILAHEAGIDDAEAFKILAAEAAARKQQKKEKISKSFKRLIEALNPRRDWLPA
ncbi:MAG: hypothetical protein QM625_05580 [Ralstonia sp.]|uniref:XRE family transcriptional regulator n=1 Tax=Ralstonia pickettii TaxID=329 RepID=A0AAW4QD21_RALPI|nr:hypothetical protein [Ralstonia pickettii]MBA9848018.1 hypothetical protein [Ralstonia pickettii]MBA9853529.1 hypothetical protein [Ralstonia pickettii]MBA9921071.1 hypothetical protein [Ralstonia pickettii]MBA9960125.1 hypothetical protein [Ralstonia pickettii]MBA9965658.1 hypothetical protein [Ralstonia pickettii]